MSDGDERLETAISWILIVGVVTSLILGAAGLALSYAQTGDQTLALTSQWRVSSNNFFSFVAAGLPSFLASPGPVGLVALGVILLMLTPYVRVIVSVLYFAKIEDLRYLGITLIVLTIITLSLLYL